MRVILQVETHVFQEDNLFDEILNEELGDDIDSCGIISPEIIVPIRRNRSPQILYEFTNSTTIKDVANVVYSVFGFDENTLMLPRLAFLKNNLRYWVNDYQASFHTLVRKHLDPENTGKISIACYICADAGRICEEDGIRYYMNSKEQGRHHEPHIHLLALDSCMEAVIIIKTREVIGEFPSKLVKKARKKVEENERFFLEQWNVLTDGLRVDINRYFGLINY